MPQTFDKDPDAVLDYNIDWTDWLNADAVYPDTIATSVWSTESADISIDSDSATLTSTKVVVSGGIRNTRYTLVNRITTANGYQDDRSIFLRVRNK